MRQFKEDVQIVIDSVQSPIYRSDSVSFHQKVFSELQDYLQLNNLEYSECAVKEWTGLQKVNASDNDILRRSSQCVSRLIDVMNYGKVTSVHLSCERISLSIENQQLLNNYIEWVRKDISPSSVNTYRWAALLFLRFAQSRKTDQSSMFSIILFEEFIDFLSESGIPSHQVSFSLVSFSEFLEHDGKLDKDLCWFFHEYPRLKRIEGYTLSFRSNFDYYRSLHNSRSLSEYLNIVSETMQYLEENGYRSAVINTSARTFRLFHLFMSRSDLPYHPILAEAWIYENKDIFLGAWFMARRALDILAAIADKSEVSIRNSSSPKYIVPGWAYDVYHTFIQLKVKERFDESTIKMFRVCIKCFLSYLEAASIHSYEEITPEIVRQFNIEDKHETNFAKNAYNSRIRRFLEYLEIEGITVRQGLQYSLSKAQSFSERFIDVLSPEEVTALEEYCEKAETPIELRDAAVLLTGIKMGLRGCDVINLDLDDINWQERTIRFYQVKTNKEICLPMPVSVGNAIYKYLSKGRPREIQSSKVFISSRKPFGSLGKVCLRAALRKALPNRNVPKSGFHVLRRTFSSIAMNSGNSTAIVAELLGHSGPDNVHKYLSLDSAHMRLCALSFCEAGIGEVPYAD